MVAIARPGSEPESAAMVSLLRANDIPCFVHGAGLASILPGLQISSYNMPTLMVPGSAVPAAMELLSVFAAPTATVAIPHKVSLRAKVRMVLETVLFGRFVSQPPVDARENATDGS